MTQVTADISVSLDGFGAGPNDRPGNGLGDGGEALHEWLHDLASFHELHGRSGGHGGTDSDILGEVFERVGSGIVGRRMYDNANGWARARRSTVRCSC